MAMAFVGRMTYENASGSPANWTTHGRSRARTRIHSASVSISMEGPCCQSARVAVDHAAVQNAKISATRSEPGTPSARRATR